MVRDLVWYHGKTACLKLYLVYIDICDWSARRWSVGLVRCWRGQIWRCHSPVSDCPGLWRRGMREMEMLQSLTYWSCPGQGAQAFINGEQEGRVLFTATCWCLVWPVVSAAGTAGVLCAKIAVTLMPFIVGLNTWCAELSVRSFLSLNLLTVLSFFTDDYFKPFYWLTELCWAVWLHGRCKHWRELCLGHLWLQGWEFGERVWRESLESRRNSIVAVWFSSWSIFFYKKY